ncbi:hypothetical protein BH09PSE1_BH09PSE1_17390 [soil metagenome]
MASTDSLNKKPYRRAPPDEWAEMRVLYTAGATAKALSIAYGPTERTIDPHGRKEGWLRKDQKVTKPDMTAEEADAAARALGRREDGGGDAACRDLAADAPLDVAARAAARAAVGMLRDGHVGAAQTYARVSGLLTRLSHTVDGGGGHGGVSLDEGVFAAIRALLIPEAEPEA